MAIPFLDTLDLTTGEQLISSYNGSTTFGVYRYTSDPNGFISANVGSICVSTDGTLWQKTVGIDANGWVQFTAAVDTNFGSTNLTADNNRTHNMSGYSLTINNMDTMTTTVTNTHGMTAGDFAMVGGYVQLVNSASGSPADFRLREASTNGTQYVGLKGPTAVTTSYSVTLPDAAPTASGQTLSVSSGVNSVATWVTPQNFASANLSAAAARTHSMGGFGLTIQSIDTLTLNGTGAAQFNASSHTLQSDRTIINNSSSTLGGVLRINEASTNGFNYVEVKAPAAIGTNWSLTLPPAAPTDPAGQVMIAGTDGVATWTTINPGDVHFRGSFTDLADLNTKAGASQPPFDVTAAGPLDYALLINTGADATWAGWDDNLSTFVEIGELQTPTVNLGVANVTTTTLDVTCNLGTDATIPQAVAGTAAGLLNAADKLKLDQTDSWTQTYGNGALLDNPIVHNLGTTKVAVTVWEETGSLRQVFPTIATTNSTTVTITHAVAPLTDAYRVIVTKVDQA